MLRRSMLAFLLTALFLTACSDAQGQIYFGESEHWQVDYGRDAVFIIKYVGVADVPEEIAYNIEQGLRTTNGNTHLNEEGFLKVKSPQDNEGDAEIQVTIDWDGNSESLTLVEK
ncbi:hypothetical protein QGM71_19890 [Virgibacillus sp. C22-A2]|uniref:Lipoprotein n=1 Tax=Virgibacillus tibetensis TaxID=3042313 RepID=A0ABU6KKQ5_9BACI|nr:hypothetical protein [Virgibacillus sp. C22-A2]